MSSEKFSRRNKFQGFEEVGEVEIESDPGVEKSRWRGAFRGLREGQLPIDGRTTAATQYPPSTELREYLGLHTGVQLTVAGLDLRGVVALPCPDPQVRPCRSANRDPSESAIDTFIRRIVSEQVLCL